MMSRPIRLEPGPGRPPSSESSTVRSKFTTSSETSELQLFARAVPFLCSRFKSLRPVRFRLALTRTGSGDLKHAMTGSPSRPRGGAAPAVRSARARPATAADGGPVAGAARMHHLCSHAPLSGLPRLPAAAGLAAGPPAPARRCRLPRAGCFRALWPFASGQNLQSGTSYARQTGGSSAALPQKGQATPMWPESPLRRAAASSVCAARGKLGKSPVVDSECLPWKTRKVPERRRQAPGKETAVASIRDSLPWPAVSLRVPFRVGMGAGAPGARGVAKNRGRSVSGQKLESEGKLTTYLWSHPHTNSTYTISQAADLRPWAVARPGRAGPAGRLAGRQTGR